MTEAAIVKDVLAKGNADVLRNLAIDEVAVVTGSALDEPVLVDASVRVDNWSLWLGRYRRIYVVKISSFSSSWTETVLSSEPPYDFAIRIDMMARVSDPAKFAVQIGPGKSVFDGFYDELRGHLQNLAQDFAPTELRAMKDRFSEVSTEVRRGNWTAGPVQVMSCTISATFGSYSMEEIQLVQLQNLVRERGDEYLLYKGKDELLRKVRQLDQDNEIRRNARLDRAMEMLRALGGEDESVRWDIGKEVGFTGALRGLLADSNDRRTPTPSTSRNVTDRLLPPTSRAPRELKPPQQKADTQDKNEGD